jgi:uncharacterized repeat protein (TIGR03803 family)
LAGQVTVLHNFTGRDGARPWGRLRQASDGYFYGTATFGGAGGAGTVFKVSATGEFQLLHSFAANLSEGYQPLGDMAEAADHSLFGSTSLYTSIFRISADGVFTTVLWLEGVTGYGFTRFFRASDGFLYGTTGQGGDYGYGTVFRMSEAGDFTTLFSFDVRDGNFPNPLVEHHDGDLYGTTVYGGDKHSGTVFRITKAGRFTRLHSFSKSDGREPMGELAEGADGNLYGVTRSGGGFDSGTIFRLAQRPLLRIQRRDGGIEVSWSSFAAGRYRVESTPALADLRWSAVSPELAATGTTTALSVPPDSESKFFRVVLLP